MEAYNLTGQIRFTGEPELPPTNERGWKDTVSTTPGFITRIIVRFGPYMGRYMYHCHILEHEDFDMMRSIEVGPRRCHKNKEYKECSQIFRCKCE